MKPKKKKIIKIVAILIFVGMLIGGGTIYYMFNMPHRDVQNTNADFSLTSSQLVNDYLSNSAEANEKYLSDDGNSKIFKITGKVALISENYNGQKVVLLKEENDNAGVSCIFLEESGSNASKLSIGETITIKGVIISGAAFDEDLEIYEHVILDKCDLVNNNK